MNLAHLFQSARAVIFDFYGTLVDDAVPGPAMWEHLNARGYRSHPELEAIFEPNAFDGTVTPTLKCEPSHDDWNEGHWRMFLRLSGVPEDRLDQELKSLMELQGQFRPQASASAVEFLRLLRAQGKRVGLCSNWESPIEPLLHEAGLVGFDGIATSAGIGARKPHARIFKEICLLLDVAPDSAIFVGDTWSTDIVGALRFGLRPVWIRRGQPARNGLDHLVVQIDSLRELYSSIVNLPIGEQS